MGPAFQYSLRIAIQPGFHDEERFEDLLAFCRAARIDDVMFFNLLDEVRPGLGDPPREREALLPDHQPVRRPAEDAADPLGPLLAARRQAVAEPLGATSGGRATVGPRPWRAAAAAARRAIRAQQVRASTLRWQRHGRR